MKYFIKPLGDSGKDSKKDNLQTKLYVAYINHDAVNDPVDLYMEDITDNPYSYKASSFISSGERIVQNSIPVILSQEEEMILFNEEY